MPGSVVSGTHCIFNTEEMYFFYYISECCNLSEDNLHVCTVHQ